MVQIVRLGSIVFFFFFPDGKAFAEHVSAWVQLQHLQQLGKLIFLRRQDRSELIRKDRKDLRR